MNYICIGDDKEEGILLLTLWVRLGDIEGDWPAEEIGLAYDLMCAIATDGEVGTEDEIIGREDAISLWADTQRNGLSVYRIEVCIMNL